MNTSNRELRAARRAKQRKQKLWSTLLWGGLAVLVIGSLGYFAWSFSRPGERAGEEVPVMSTRTHVQEGEDPGPFNSTPMTSGPHYGSEYEAGFYNETDPLVTGVPYPEGYLGHNLEHGYVIYWYNCDALPDEKDCDTLKTQIKNSMAANGGVKLIAFPHSGIDAPLVMTSWGRMQRFETFDPELAAEYVRTNLNQSPEPNAP